MIGVSALLYESETWIFTFAKEIEIHTFETRPDAYIRFLRIQCTAVVTTLLKFNADLMDVLEIVEKGKHKWFGHGNRKIVSLANHITQ